jgi:hypothetical protein
MTREEFIENCKSIRHNGKGFVVNTVQRTPTSLCTIHIEHDELLPYVIGVFNEEPAVFIRQGEYFKLETTEYFDSAWKVLSRRIDSMCGKKKRGWLK